MNRDLLTRLATAAIAATAAVIQAACGGGGDMDGTTEAASRIVPPLIADDGSPMPSDPQASPADAAAWTVAGLYASAEQVEMLGVARADLLHVEVSCCGIEAADLAVWTAYGLRAAYDLPTNAPILVSGRDLRLAASVVDRLGEGGMTRVWLVTTLR